MHLRSFRFRQFLCYLLPALLYPVYAWISAEQKLKLLKFIDALTIMGFVFLILGIIYSLLRHGDFDITEYVAKRSLRKGRARQLMAVFMGMVQGKRAGCESGAGLMDIDSVGQCVIHRAGGNGKGLPRGVRGLYKKRRSERGKRLYSGLGLGLEAL